MNFFTSTIIVVLLLFFTACGDSGGSGEKPTIIPPPTSYNLTSLTDDEFNALLQENKLIVADKLLSSMFYGYPLAELQTKIDSGSFISDLQIQIFNDKTNKAALEAYIMDPNIFYRFDNLSYPQQAHDIVARLYAAPNLDKYFFHNWIAYTLTQTIMFSPAYELDSVGMEDIALVYNELVSDLEAGNNIQDMSYKHMISQSNWRRFRSPEDNGREMLEIFAYDFNDSHVPIAGQALQNWSNVRRNSDGFNQLVIDETNVNIETLNLFGTTITDGESFYRALVDSDVFTYGVTKRLVTFFFADYDEAAINGITASLVKSGHTTWQGIFKEILFSKEYLLNSSRVKRGEELFFSLAKKMEHQHTTLTIRDFCIGSYQNLSLADMNQASMKYKLGKLSGAPVDTLSFATYSTTIRENVFYKRSDPAIADYAWNNEGWSDSFIANTNFTYDSTNQKASLESLINYIFRSTVSRKVTPDELLMFEKYMLNVDNTLKHPYMMFDVGATDEVRETFKRHIAFMVLDYISRLDILYMQREVK